ncbi:MAG: serine hydrolase domain-containing protein, partial [Gemmatimonadota bacterium]|nr:serine hydrolase domain-containing protein [Gemmatimonadota bacterium]
YIASSTKSFTALAASILHERGELDLDAPLSRYLPRAELHEDLDPDAITLRDLLTHTHGIAGVGPIVFRTAYSGVHTHDQLVDLLPTHGPAENGRAFRYSNVGYNIASLAMDATLDAPWKDVLAREIFGPLGMRSTTGYLSRIPRERLAMPYGVVPEGYVRRPYSKGDDNMHAAGGLVTTVADAALWLRANLNGGRLGGERILDERAIAETHRKQAEQDATFLGFERDGYGLGWVTGSYDGDTVLHHFGGFPGFHAHISFMPDHDLGVAVLVDSGSGARLADAIARRAYDELRSVPNLDSKWEAELASLADAAAERRARVAADLERRAARPQDLPHPRAAYVGAFANGELGTIEVSLSGDGALRARIGRMESEVEVYDAEKNMLRVELTGGGTVMPVEFEEGEDRAVRLRWLGRVFERVPG